MAVKNVAASVLTRLLVTVLLRIHSLDSNTTFGYDIELHYVKREEK